MLPSLGRAVAAISPPRRSTIRRMFTSSADVFRMRQAIGDLNNVVVSGRDAISRFSTRAHVDAFPRLIANRGRFRLLEDRDFYSDVLLAAAMPDEDFPAFTTATSILLIDLLQNGDSSDNLYWNWDSFQDQYRLADPAIRAALMNGFRLGFETGSVRIEAPPDPTDCLTLGLADVRALLEQSEQRALLTAIDAMPPEEAGKLWEQNSLVEPQSLPGFRYLYERPASMVPSNQATAPLIPWS